jgi:hypothetical protein
MAVSSACLPLYLYSDDKEIVIKMIKEVKSSISVMKYYAGAQECCPWELICKLDYHKYESEVKGTNVVSVLPIKSSNEDDPKAWIAYLAFILEKAYSYNMDVSNGAIYTFIEYQDPISWGGVINISNRILTIMGLSSEGEPKTMIFSYKGSPEIDKNNTTTIITEFS